MMRLLIIGLLSSIAGLTAMGQDLGSSNKLFGGAKKKTSPAKSTKKAAKPSAKKPSSTSWSAKAATAKSRTPASAKQEKAAKKNSAAKSVSITKSTATKTEAPVKRTANEPSAAVTEKRYSPDSKGGVSGIVSPKSGGGVSKSSGEIAVDPVDASVQYEKFILQGNSARDDRDYVAAEAAYKKARLLKPTDSRAVYGLGNLFSDQLRWQEAEKHYRSAIEMTPNDAVAHIALSYVLVQPVTASNLADRYDEAEKLARRALELAPANALALDQLGVSLELRGFIGEETENAYRKAIQMDPAFAPPHAHLGRLLRRRGLTKEASAAYQNAIDRSRDVGTRILVAEVLQSEQRYSDSEVLLNAALKEDPRNPTALLLLARAQITASKFDDAEAALKKALSIGANGFMANNQLAAVYLRQGKPELAENALLQAARFVSELDKRSLSQSFEAVGDAYMKAGNNRSAERAFKQAITFDAETDILSGKLSRAQQGRFGPG